MEGNRIVLHVQLVYRWRSPCPAVDPDPGSPVFEFHLVEAVADGSDDDRIPAGAGGDNILELRDCTDIGMLSSPDAPQLPVITQDTDAQT